jgi:excisionase family DNA binding protein
VAEAAHILGVSEMTMYRAIRSGVFPAVQLMGRLIIPKRAIDEIIDTGALVNTQDSRAAYNRGPQATPNCDAAPDGSTQQRRHTNSHTP